MCWLIVHYTLDIFASRGFPDHAQWNVVPTTFNTDIMDRHEMAYRTRYPSWFEYDTLCLC